MLGINHFLECIEAATRLILIFGPVLGFYRVLFALNVFGGKQRVDEKLAEPVQRRLQESGIDIEKVIGVFKTGIGVVLATVSGDKFLVLSSRWILLRTQE